MRFRLTLVLAGLGALLPGASARAGCAFAPGQAATVAGEVAEAWHDRAGRAFYKVEPDTLPCDGEVSYLLDPRGTLLCRVGQHLEARGTYEPVTFDFTGSGYLVRIEALTCGKA